MQSSVNVFAESQRELGYLRDDQYAILKGWNDLLKGVPYRMTSPNAFLYVDVDPQTAFSRVQARGRSEEASVTVDYLADLKRLHDKWLLNEQEYSVFRVDGTLPMNRLVPGIVAQLEKWRLCEVFRASALPKGLPGSNFGVDDGVAMARIHSPHTHRATLQSSPIWSA